MNCRTQNNIIYIYVSSAIDQSMSVVDRNEGKKIVKFQLTD